MIKVIGTPTSIQSITTSTAPLSLVRPLYLHCPAIQAMFPVKLLLLRRLQLGEG